MNNYIYYKRVRELMPGIERQDEKENFDKLNSHESQLKTEELFFRAIHK